MAQKPPQRVDAPKSGSNSATLIFLHGVGDDTDGWMNIAQQFYSANKLPYLSWIFPNAPHNHEAITTAWYTPTSFSPIPVGRSSQHAFAEENEEEFDGDGEAEILKSVEYVCGVIDEEVQRGVPLKRIVVGGFSQGCAVSLVVGLASRHQGKLGAVVGLSGYLPRGGKIRVEREMYEKEAEEEMRVFLGHGTRDRLVPMRVYRDTKARVAHIVGKEVMETHEYEGLGHDASDLELREMCEFLEKLIPAYGR